MSGYTCEAVAKCLPQRAIDQAAVCFVVLATQTLPKDHIKSLRKRDFRRLVVSFAPPPPPSSAPLHPRPLPLDPLRRAVEPILRKRSWITVGLGFLFVVWLVHRSVWVTFGSKWSADVLIRPAGHRPFASHGKNLNLGHFTQTFNQILSYMSCV